MRAEDCEPSAVAASARAVRHKCPAGCSKTFDTPVGALVHMGRSSRCLAKHKEAGILVRRRAVKGPRVGRVAVDEAFERFEGDRRSQVADTLASLSLDDDLEEAQIGRVKQGVQSILGVCARELTARFAALSRSSSDVDVKQIVERVLDVFHGLQSQQAVFSELESRYPYIEPVEHIFGYDYVHTTDAEGFTHSKKKVKSAGWFVPMTRVIERLCQEDPRALEQVLQTQRRMGSNPPRVRHLSEGVCRCDGRPSLRGAPRAGYCAAW
jgi:hypothetical protein